MVVVLTVVCSWPQGPSYFWLRCKVTNIKAEKSSTAQGHNTATLFCRGHRFLLSEGLFLLGLIGGNAG